MILAQAKIEARKLAEGQPVRGQRNPPITMVVVREGPHADEFAERDADGKSYGYCPAIAKDMLYKYGEVIELIEAMNN